MSKPLNKPNGERVTQGQLYKALYQLDQNMAEAFTAVHEALNDVRGALEKHREDGHPYTQVAEVALAKHRLDGKKVAFRTGILALAATAGAVGLKILELV